MICMDPKKKLEIDHQLDALVNLLSCSAKDLDSSTLWNIAARAGEIQKIARAEANRLAGLPSKQDLAALGAK